MKKSGTIQTSQTIAEKKRQFIIKIKEAETRAETSKHLSRLAKKRLKEARKAFKLAKKVAKRARKHIKELQKAMAAALKTKRPSKKAAKPAKPANRPKQPAAKKAASPKRRTSIFKKISAPATTASVISSGPAASDTYSQPAASPLG